MHYSNPRLDLIVEDWPSGSYRTTAIFHIETHPKRGQRCSRKTKHPTKGFWNAAKQNTFAKRQRIVDGEDGKTYILRDCGSHVNVQHGDLQYDAENIWPKDERWGHIQTLLID